MCAKKIPLSKEASSAKEQKRLQNANAILQNKEGCYLHPCDTMFCAATNSAAFSAVRLQKTVYSYM